MNRHTTIVIEASGAIRMNRGGMIHTWDNTVWLAEAMANEMDQVEHLRKYVDAVRRAADGPLGEMTASEIQQRLLKAINEEIPF